MYKLTLLLFLLLGWIQYSLWFGKNGVCDYISVNNDIVFQQINNAKLKARNCQLLAEINQLNKKSIKIEELARNELNMLKPNEIFYRLVVNNQKK